MKLSSEADAFWCEAGVVWSGFEITESTGTPSVRAGITFRDTDRMALKQLFFEGRPRSRRWHAETNVDLRISAGVRGTDNQMTAPQKPLSIMRKPVDRRRPRAVRLEVVDLPWLSTVSLPWGLEMRPLNISSTGLLLESRSRSRRGASPS